jgi:hypothetical protein
MNRMFLSFIIIQFAFIAGTVSATSVTSATFVVNNLNTGATPTAITFGATTSTNGALQAAGQITVTVGSSVFSVQTTPFAVTIITTGTGCTATATTTASVLTVTLADAVGDTCAIASNTEFSMSINIYIAANAATAGAVIFTMATSADTTATASATGYTTVAAATQAYSSQPAATDTGLAGTAVNITFTLGQTEGQRCVVLAAATAAPANANAITAGTGAVGTSPAAASATGGQSTTISYTGLSAATAYKIYCATASGVLSTATGVAFTTAVDTTTTTTSAPNTTTTAAAKKDELSVATELSTSIVALFGTMFALFLANL